MVHSAFVLASGNMLLQVLLLLYRMLLSRFAGAESLGVYRLVFSVYSVLNAGCLSGIIVACEKQSAVCLARGGEKEFSVFVQASFRLFAFPLGAAVLLVCCGKDFIAQRVLGDARCEAALPVLLPCLALTGIENILKAICIGSGKVQQAALSEIGEQSVRIIAVFLLLRTQLNADCEKTAFLIFCGMVVSELFSAAFMLSQFRSVFAEKIDRGAAKIRSQMQQLSEIALPLSISALSVSSISSASAVLLPDCLIRSGLSSQQALASMGIVTGVSLPLILLPSALIGPVCTVLLPAISRAQAHQDQNGVQHLVTRTFSVIPLIGFPATAILMPLLPPMGRLLFGQSLLENDELFLGLSAGMLYMHMASSTVLNALGMQKQNMTISILCELLQVGLTVILARNPQLRVQGYLLAMGISSFTFALAGWRIVFRRGFLQKRLLHRLGRSLLCAAVLHAFTRMLQTALLWCPLPKCFVLPTVLLLSCGLYFLLLRAFGVHLLAYLGRRRAGHGIDT